MIRSMTGFGRASVSSGGRKIHAEVRSLNSRQLDLSFKLPAFFREQEGTLRSKVADLVVRGKAEFSVIIEESSAVQRGTINRDLAKAYFEELRALSADLGIAPEGSLGLVLQMPEVMRAQKEVTLPEEEDWHALESAMSKALAAFDQFRKKEGKVLEEDLKMRVRLIQSLLKEVEKLDKPRFEAISRKLKQNMKEHAAIEKIDKNRFEQELIYYFEKLDITEEVLRLNTHCNYFLSTSKEDNCGRKLGFICQEIGREINTIGSKANDAGIQKLVVQMKDELEKIKEQLMNVL